MMTTVSIDTVGAASGEAAVSVPGEAASCRLSEDKTSVTGGGTQLPQDEAVALFQRTLAEQTAENAALGESMRAALVSVSSALARVDAVASAPVDAAGDAAVPADAAVQVLGEAPSVGLSEVSTPAPSGAIGTLPEQISQNAALGSDLDAAVALVDAAASALGEAMPVSLSEVKTPVSDGVTETLPEQISQNAALGSDLDAAAALVDAAASAVGKAASDRLSEVEAPVADGGTPLARTVDETDLPEASADALVAAGATPNAVAQTAVTPSETAAVVAPVDVVRVQAAEAVAPAAVLVQAAEAVADTLLVTPGLLRGQGEVLVQLRPDVLDGTEVKISVTGRQLDVIFQPQTVNMAVLIENCRSQLVQHLAAKIATFNVSVDVRKKRG